MSGVYSFSTKNIRIREDLLIFSPKKSFKMATSVDSTKVSDGTSMERFGSGGMTLLPWTKQILSVLWEHLRLLLQVIYISFLSVFQMFRFEVHLRITDENGQHVQHMSTAANQPESFLFSSLFDGDNGVMVGGSNPLSGSSTAEALLSTLRADDFTCCGLVDDFVSRTAGKEDGIFLGHHPSWKMGFSGDWNIFGPSTDSSGTDHVCHNSTEKVYKQNSSEEERCSHWSSEEDQNLGDFDSEESKALWESLSKSSDPYNPFFFSACISTNTNMGKGEVKHCRDNDCMSASKTSEELLMPQGLNFWVNRSDSDNSWSSWGSSDGSCADLDKEESERLWDLFSSPVDPYNPMCFTASTASSTSLQTSSAARAPQSSLPAASSKSDTEEKERSTTPSSLEDDDEEEGQLWKSLCQSDDPYHPLNFQACLQSSPTSTLQPQWHSKRDTEHPSDSHPKSLHSTGTRELEVSQSTGISKPILPERPLKRHNHTSTRLVPWRKSKLTPGSLVERAKLTKSSTSLKKVRFSPVVQVHVMRTWPFARQASRKGHWEEMARDRDRFQRRIQETEQSIGHCFSLSHRERIQAYLDST